jgi:hypothetical protein
MSVGLVAGPGLPAHAVVATTTVVVRPETPNGWAFGNDLVGTGTGSGAYVVGPATPPAGYGSAQLTVDSQGRWALGTLKYAGTPLSQINTITYSTYRPSSTTNHSLDVMFDIDTDTTDGNTTYQGRLASLPALEPANTWTAHDALNDTWFWSHATPSDPCTQAIPCTWAQVLAAFPNGAIRPSIGAFLFRAGGPYAGGNVGYVDKATIGNNAGTTTFDFEPTNKLTVTPPSGPKGTAVTVSGSGFGPGTTVKVKYKTGKPSPAGIALCQATVQPNSTFSCNGTIPTGANAGAFGVHNIVAKNTTDKHTGTFTLTH